MGYQRREHGTQFLNVNVGRCLINFKKTETQQCSASLLCLPLWPSLLLSQKLMPNGWSTLTTMLLVYLLSTSLYNQVPVVKPVVNPVVYKHVPAVAPVVKYVDPHHTEGMTKQGVPEKTDSVKIAEKQHELAQQIEKSKVNVGYVAPYTTYAGVYPYVHPVAHVVAKREADSEADPAYFYNNYAAGVYPYATTYGTPYTTAVAGYPYTAAVSGYTYPNTFVNHPAQVVYRGKRDADSDAQLYYSRYASPYAYNYGAYNHAYTYSTPYTYGYNGYRWF